MAEACLSAGRLVQSERFGRYQFVRRTAGMLFLAGIFIGCEKSPPPVMDLSKAPWLDPEVQIEGLKDSDMRIRGVSAINLGNIGAAAADAIPALEKLAKDDPEPKVRENAANALEKIRAALAQ
jgi:hypothetical protein